MGGAHGLAQLFLAAGLLHLEGTATSLLASSYAGLSSLRSPFAMSGPPPSHAPGTSADGAEVWRKDRQHAARFFMRARALSPGVDVPLLPAEETEDEGSLSAAESSAGSGTELAVHRRQRTPPRSGERDKDARQRRRGQPRAAQQPAKLEMPTIDVARPSDPPLPPMRRRRKREPGYGYRYGSDDADAELSSSMMESVHKEPDMGAEDEDRTWYLYVPGLVGAGTALLIVGLLGLQNWRKNQG